MNCLSLYVEKWYIVGAVCTGNGLQRIVPPNEEDRIWLYFFEDVANDRVFYGKNNKRSAQNREPHYYQDVFGSMVDSEATFKKFGKNYPLAEIFKYSNILDDLRGAYAKWASDEKIPTYLSFSQDISSLAKSMFIEQLEKNGFVIKQFAGKIELLAMEWLTKTSQLRLPKDKKVLVLTSSNENLHMSVYNTDGNLHIESSSATLPGYGRDVRRQAVIDEVIKQGNSTLKFLTRQDEFDHEMKRMEDSVEEWILKLDSGRPGIPVRITDINFSLAPDNKFTANLKSKTIDERTQAIIRNIIDYVKKFVIDKVGIHEYDLGAVVLIGNSFENNQYFKEIDQWLQINERNMFKVNEVKLPDVVSVYSQIPEDYFSTEEQFFGAQTEEERILQAKNEAERAAMQKAKDELALKKQTEEEKTRAEKAYKDAMDQYYEAEGKRDFANMREFLQIALEKKAGDPVATGLLAQLEDIVRKEDLKNEQYRNAINAADKYFEDGDYDDALSFYTQAITIDANSVHSKERIKQIRKIKEDVGKAGECLTRAGVFEGQKLYSKALTELNKAKLLDPDNPEIISKIEEISGIISAKEKKINTLKATLSSSEDARDFSSAIAACKELVLNDEDNSGKWERKANELERKKEKEDEKNKVLAECKTIVSDASFNDDWEKVLSASTKALTYNPTDEYFQKYFTKATAEVAKAKAELAKKKISDTGKAFIETTRNIKDIGKKAVGHLPGRVDDFFGTVTKRSEPKSLPEKKSDDFFSTGKPDTKKNEPKAAESKRTNDDFFDSESASSNKAKPKTSASNKTKVPDGFDF